jgi:hypothetical protein
MGHMAVVIDPRFNGPPTTGHGGYSAGRAAALLDAPAVEVTLRKPPPLGVPLAVGRDGDGASLYDGHELIAEARPVELAVDGPGPVAHGVAAAASARFEWQDDHPFPTCFGCGPDRDPADALCLYTGPVGDGRFAVPWTPPAWSGEATVDPVFVWAALDCPSSAPVHMTISAPIVLGRFTVAIEGPVEVGAPHVIQSWLEHLEGRKYQTAVELWTTGGERRAIGRSVWIELAKPQ